MPSHAWLHKVRSRSHSGNVRTNSTLHLVGSAIVQMCSQCRLMHGGTMARARFRSSLLKIVQNKRLAKLSTCTAKRRRLHGSQRRHTEPVAIARLRVCLWCCPSVSSEPGAAFASPDPLRRVQLVGIHFCTTRAVSYRSRVPFTGVCPRHAHRLGGTCSQTGTTARMALGFALCWIGVRSPRGGTSS